VRRGLERPTMRRCRMGRCCRLTRGPPERPALAVEIPADVNTGCAFAKACCLGSPEWNGLARFASAAGCRRRLPYLRHGPTRIVGDYLRVLFGGRQSRNARRRPGHRRVPISAPRVACAPSTLGPPRRGTISPREPAPESQKSPAGNFLLPPLAGLRRLGQGRAESAARYPCLSRVPPHAARLPNASHQEDSRRFESKCYRGRSR
jgi:hypothetical protein